MFLNWIWIRIKKAAGSGSGSALRKTATVDPVPQKMNADSQPCIKVQYHEIYIR